MRIRNNLLKSAAEILSDASNGFPDASAILLVEIERYIRARIKSYIEEASEETLYSLMCEINCEGNYELLQLAEAVNQGWVTFGKNEMLLYGPKSSGKNVEICLNGSLDELRPIFDTAPEPLRKKYFDSLQNECLSDSDREKILSALELAFDSELKTKTEELEPNPITQKSFTSILHDIVKLSRGYVLKIFSDNIQIPQIDYCLVSPVVRSADSQTTDNSGESKEEQVKPSWVEIKLEDEEGNPVPGKKYKIELPDGTIATGTLDEKGFARVEGIDPDRCEITFPEFDKEA